MGKPQLGTKCTCTGCHERFYDLNRSPAVCPKCGAQQSPEAPRSLRPSRSTFGTRYQPRQVPLAAAVEDDVEAADAIEAAVDDPDDEADDETDDESAIDVDLDRPAD